MNFTEKFSAVFQKLSLVQRAMLGAVLLTFVIASIFLTKWAGRPDMRMLYNELNPDDTAKITDKISELGIPYELKNGGTTVYVPQEHLYQLRVDLAREGLPTESQGGYKIFDEEKIGISPFVQNVNLQRALQDELSKSIQMIDGIKHARVHIVTPEKKLFNTSEEQTSASVVLRLQPGYQLATAHIAAITHLVSGAVENLESKEVTVVDSKGKLLSKQMDNSIQSSAGTIQDYKERVESTLTAKVEGMLTAVLGPGRASVQVSADIDMTSIDLMTEKYDPETKVASKEEITSSSQIENSQSSEAAAPGSTSKEETILTEYMISKTVEKKTELAGAVKSLSVAAFVDLTVDDPNADTSGKGLLMEVADVEQVIKNAIGLKDSDSLKVVNVKFNRKQAPDEQIPEETKLNIAAIAGQASLGIMAVCALVVLKMFSGGKKTASLETLQQGQGQQGQMSLGAGSSAGMLPDNTLSDPAILRNKIASAMKSNPAEARQLFTNWIENKG